MWIEGQVEAAKRCTRAVLDAVCQDNQSLILNYSGICGIPRIFAND